jgi:hypothetical protein
MPTPKYALVNAAQRRVCIQRGLAICGADAAQNNRSGVGEVTGHSNTG